MKTKSTLVLALLFVGLITRSQCTFTSTPYSPNQPGITNFKMANVNRTSTAIEGNNALVITGTTMTLTIGQTYSFSITSTNDLVSGAPLTGAPQHCRIYADFNNDLDFIDAGETAFSYDYITFTPTNAATSTYTNAAAVTVPATVVAGPGKLRVTAKMGPAAGHSPPSPCNTPSDPAGYHGEMEEYNVVFVTSTPANAGFATSSTVCVNAAMSMTNNSFGNPTPTYTWSTNPAAVISNSTATNPTITFTNAGTYSITLAANNTGTVISSATQTVLASVCAGINEQGVNRINASLAPNPFNQTTKLSYQLEKSGLTTIAVYNILGTKVASILNEEQSAGTHEVFINKVLFTKGTSGIYFVELTSGNSFYKEKIVVID